MRPIIETLVDEVADLVSPPQLCEHIKRLVNDSAVGTEQIADAIAQDPALTAQLLRLANDPRYGSDGVIDTVTHACERIGRDRVRELVIARGAANLFEGLSNELVSMLDFWRHSLLCAVAARELARFSRVGVAAEALFTAGMLHDIGDLVLFNRMPHQAREVLLLTAEGPGEPEIHEVERRVIGFDHCEVGRALALRWDLPPLLTECIAHHHAPRRASRYPEAAALVHIANTVACWAELNSRDREEAPRIDPAAWALTGLTPEHALAAIGPVRTMISGVEAMFLP